MSVINCTCGLSPEISQVQLFNVIRCDECDKQAYHLNYQTCVSKWNELSAPIKHVNIEKLSPIDFYIQKAESAK